MKYFIPISSAEVMLTYYYSWHCLYPIQCNSLSSKTWAQTQYSVKS